MAHSSFHSSQTYIQTHKYIVLLLVSNGEFSLSLLVRSRERFQVLDGFGLADFDAEFDVALCVLVARLWMQSV